MFNDGLIATTGSWLENKLVDRPFFTLDVPGVPIAKGRPRMARSGHVYTPQKTRDYEDQIRLAAAVRLIGKKPTERPVIVHFAAFFEPPKSYSRTRRTQLFTSGGHHAIKPDLDNLLKAATDAICGENGAIADDKQIIEISCFKTYTEQNAGISIDVFEVAQDCERLQTRWREWQKTGEDNG